MPRGCLPQSSAVHHIVSCAAVVRLIAVLQRQDRKALEGFVAVALDLLDALDSDLEAEPGTWAEDHLARTPHYQAANDAEDLESTGDELDCTWIEYSSQRHPRQCETGGPEDWEEDDPSGGMAEDDFSALDYRRLVAITGPGCKLADAGE